MTRTTRQVILGSMAALLALLLVLFAANPGVVKDPKPPRDSVPAMAAWIARHPADWLTAAEIADSALDASVPQRRELWRASYQLAHHLAPRLRNAPAAFVRGGLFHWYELDDAERKAVLNAAAPLLHEPGFFNSTHQPLWQLTRDFDYLLRNAPPTLDALGTLRAMAAMHGLFPQYRATRAAMEKQRIAELEHRLSSLAPHDLPSLLPRRLTTADEPVIHRILQELHQRSFEPGKFGGAITPVIEYAIAHRLQPLEGLAPFADVTDIPEVTRARLALALDHPDAASAIELGSSRIGSPEWLPYQLERALYEAKRVNTSTADMQLRRAAVHGLDAAVLATAEQCATLAGNKSAAAMFRQQLAALKREPAWRGTCGPNEVCDAASAMLYSAGGGVEVKADVAQSDQIPPYVEIYADDARVAEGEVASGRRFALPLAQGMHRIEVRLVNPRMTNGSQRRVRLS